MGATEPARESCQGQTQEEHMDQPQAPMTPPPPQPQWTPPPQQPTGWGGQGYGGPPPGRPMGVTLGSLYLIIIGILELLVGVLFIAGGAFLSSTFNDVQGSGVFAGVGAFLGILIGFWAILQLLGGIGSIQGKGWGRWIGIIVSIIGAIFLGLGALGSLSNIGGNASGFVFTFVWFLLYAGTAWALISAGAYFSYRR